MKRARPASLERLGNGNDDANSTEQTKETLHMSLQEIMSLCDGVHNEDARKIVLAATTLQHGNQQAMTPFFSAWGVKYRNAGEPKKRPLRDLKAELHAKLAKCVRELQEKESCNSSSEQRPTTSVP